MLKMSSTVILGLGTAITGCAAAESAAHSFASSSCAGCVQSRSEGALSGGDGRIFVNGDVVEVRRGEITVNGISYGNASPGSRIRYIVEGQKRQLFVDNEERKPHR